MITPPVKRCKCGSFECPPTRCRFDDPVNAYADATIRRDKVRPDWERDQSGRFDMDLRGGGRGVG